jgi:N6-adenosine-specific RNA methylase IME4
MKLRKRFNLSQSLETTVSGHSVKPEESYRVIEEWLGMETEKLELFARRPRNGWDTWGLELEPYYRRGAVGSLIAL